MLQKSEIYTQILYSFVFTIERLYLLAYEWVHFGYDKYFTPNIISSLKKDLTKYKAHY